MSAPLPAWTSWISRPLVDGRWKSFASCGVTGAASSPRYACSALPLEMIWAATLRTVLIGIAKPMPTFPCSSGRPGRDLRGDADHPPLGVDQRAARVAVVDRGVGLDRVVDRQRVRRLDLALDGADDTRREGAREAERVADRIDGVADDDGIGVAELERSERTRMRIDLEDRHVRGRVLADDGGGDLVLTGEGDLHLLRALDHVVVGDDVTGLVDHEARPERLARLRCGRQQVERIGRHLGDRRRSDLDDAGSVAAIDLLRRQRPPARRGLRGGGDARSGASPARPSSWCRACRMRLRRRAQARRRRLRRRGARRRGQRGSGYEPRVPL